MGVIREYRCTAHDHEFESGEENPPCPYGCHPKFVVMEFRTPFAIGSERSGRIDRLTTQIASDYGLTNMRNDRDSSVMQQTLKESGGMRRIACGSVEHEYRAEQMPTWAPSVFRPQPGWAKTGDVPVFDWKNSGMKGPGGISRTKPQLDLAKHSLRNNTTIEASWNKKP